MDVKKYDKASGRSYIGKVHSSDIDAEILSTNVSKGICGESILSSKAIFWGADGKLYTASNSNAMCANGVAGVSRQSGTLGNEIEFTSIGIHTEPSWTFTAGDAVYLGTAGNITQSAISDIALQIGVATSATSIQITSAIWGIILDES
jgi:hypothetical protein